MLPVLLSPLLPGAGQILQFPPSPHPYPGITRLNLEWGGGRDRHAGVRWALQNSPSLRKVGRSLLWQDSGSGLRNGCGRNLPKALWKNRADFCPMGQGAADALCNCPGHPVA